MGHHRRTILHVGRHKTGTSSLQRALATRSQALAEAGVLYPNAGRRGNAHHLLARAFLGKTRRDPVAAAAAKAIVREAVLEVQDWAGDVVLSSEVFQNVKRVGRITELVEPAGCHVVIYLRERYSYAQSSYAQVVHAKRWTGTFTDYLAGFETDYTAFLRRWEDWKPDRLCVRPFARSVLVDGDVIADFAVAAELPVGILTATPHDANPSLGGALLEFKRVLNSLPPLSIDESGYNVLSRVAARNPVFRIRPEASPDAALAYRRRFAAMLAELTPRYPQLAALGPVDRATSPSRFGSDDFRAVWAAITAESPSYAAACHAVFDAAAKDDPTVRLIAAAAT